MNMREKLARALALKDAQAGPQSRFIDQYASHEAYVEAHWQGRLGAVDAVLDTLREPDEAMIAAGELSSDIEGGWEGPRFCWTVMLDAAKAGR